MMRALTVCSLALVALADDKSMKMFEVKASASGGLRAPQQQVSDLNLGLGQLYPGSRAWQDLQESAWKRIPEWMVGAQMLVPSSVITGTKQMLWDCASTANTGSAYCELYAFMYSCLGCDFETGNFQMLMASKGFTMFRCAPSVMSRTGGGEHQMIGFMKVVPAGTEYTLDISAPTTEFVTFGMNQKPSPSCSTHMDAAACAGTKDKCEWDGGECVLKQCIRIPIGPGSSVPCTDLCINDDL